ncbi:helix-turn-helix domain-containing protein [Novosphingobium sp.]|uniref:helix-turn-helix domain-containing protein n=1 Tax=Novosphingobium sp. TaxID=1874826 RepID=UPI002605F930|nr:helix-turn-helix domain-containing protein [Novosphingobium sp.]
MTRQLLLTEEEAAQRLRLSPRTLRKARGQGKLHYVLIGRAVRYTEDDLTSFIDSLRTVQPACPKKPETTRNARTKGRGAGAQIIPFTERNAGRSGR